MTKQISSSQHPLVKHLVKLRKNHDYRDTHQSVFIEGIKFVRELCSYHPAKVMMVSHEDLLPLQGRGDNCFLVTEEVMKKISGMENPEGIVAEVPFPSMDAARLKTKKHLIALDSINDPGNLGTLLRTALALGWEGAFILEGSCDPFNEKAIRAARGATFQLPLAIGSWEDLRALIDQSQWQLWAADLDGTTPDAISMDDKILLVLGNEAHGLSAEANQLCQKITIPMPGPMESLNVSVAGGILMYCLTCSKKAR